MPCREPNRMVAGTVVSGPVSADGYTWYQITTDVVTGWVRRGAPRPRVTKGTRFVAPIVPPGFIPADRFFVSAIDSHYQLGRSESFSLTSGVGPHCLSVKERKM